MGVITDRLDWPLTHFDNDVIIGISRTGYPKKIGGVTYTFFEGMWVTGYGQGEASTVILMDSDNHLHMPMGFIIRNYGGFDVDEPLKLGKPCTVIMPGRDTSFWCPIATAAGPVLIDAGDIIVCAGGTDAGYGKKLPDAVITGATNYPHLHQKIGIAKHGDNMTDGATKLRWIKVKGGS